MKGLAWVAAHVEYASLPWRYHDGGRKAAGYTGRAPGDCVTRAVAIATGLPYQRVYDALNSREAGKVRRRTTRQGSARTGVHKDVSKAYLRSLGWTWTPTMQIGSGCTVHLRAGELPERGTLIVSVSKHLCVVKDGIIYDTHDPSRRGTRCVYGYWQQGKDCPAHGTRRSPDAK